MAKFYSKLFILFSYMSQTNLQWYDYLHRKVVKVKEQGKKISSQICTLKHYACGFDDSTYG